MSVIARAICLLVVSWFWLTVPAFGGTPLLQDNCVVDRQKVPITYDPRATRYFAEARPERVGSRRFVIYVNPTLYFLGQQTQQWLYLRQCVHILKNHQVASQGERALQLREEEEADCEALTSLTETNKNSSPRMARLSIESDMQRALRESHWQQILPGPPRQIAFEGCRN